MKSPAVFFDRDNTLIINDGYLGDPDGVKLMPGAADAIARAHELGFAVVTISNQSGVAKGLFTEEDVHAVNTRLAAMLTELNPSATIDRHEFCPFHPVAAIERYRLDSDLRKPKPGMLLRAAKMLDLDLPASWLIGDAPRDIEAGKAAGCRTIRLQPANVASSPAAQTESSALPDATVTSLADAMDFIASNGTTAKPPRTAPIVQSSTPAPIAIPTADLTRLTTAAEQILAELRLANQGPGENFSLGRLLAGVFQVIALSCLLGAYLVSDRTLVEPWLLVGLILQTFTLTLLVMGTIMERRN